MSTVAKVRDQAERRNKPRHGSVRPFLRGRFFTGVRPVEATDERVKTRDGRELVLRSIRPDDIDALRRGFDRLTPEEVRMRFLHPLNELPETFARELCELDPDVAFAWVLADADDAASPEIHAVARAFVDKVLDQAEFAIVVEGSLSRQGFGTLLMHRVIDSARKLGATELWSDVLLENGAMLGVCEALGFTRSSALHNPGVLRVTLPI
ncbi:MAG: GNAT family N-acetyltransferase [Rudaea sp.]